MITIDGKRFAEMLESGTAALASNEARLNALNVFPVSDGDTGTNMLRTMEGGIARVKAAVPEKLGEAAAALAQGMFLSARGNSGVILSQIFAGIAQGLHDLACADAPQLARAYEMGIERAYAAVQEPVEGTILTVYRESARYAGGKIAENASVEDFYRLHLQQAQRSLQQTPQLLRVLKEADVVDSGAAGYVCIVEGMYAALTGKALSYREGAPAQAPAVDIDRFTRDSRLEFGYCTEFLLRLMSAKVDPDHFPTQTILDDLKRLGGESVVADRQGDIVKIHVHTFIPGQILTQMQCYGEFLTLKIENMALGHKEELRRKSSDARAFSVVATACGDGIAELFTKMGADRVILGGQTINPSVEEFVRAFDACAGEDILVLPNHKNVFLAAQQAASVYERARVHVIETKSMLQGYAALSVITPGITDMAALVESAQRAAHSIADGRVTRAVRDAQGVHCGDYLAFGGAELLATADSAENAACKLLERLDADDAEIITVFVGREVDEARRAAFKKTLSERYPQHEVVVYEGGQEVYDYLMGVE